MKKLFRTALAATMLASASAAALTAVPASAQVAGIATSNPEVALLRSAARIAAYDQINTQYTAQIQQITQLSNELNQLEQSLDTDRNGQLTEAEAQANQAAYQEAQQKSQQLDQLSLPIQIAQMYVLEQLIRDYDNARNVAVQARGVQVLLDASAVQMAPENFDITSDIVAALDQRMPSVQFTPPANYQPSQGVVQTHQTISQLIGIAVRRAQIQAAQQQQAGQPVTQPVTPAPQGR